MTLESKLAVLENAELIRLAQSFPEAEYLFRHVLVQDAAYQSLLRATRRELHRAIGEAIERLYPQQADSRAPILARHFAEADEPARALEYYRRGAELAAARYANDEALLLFSEALSMAQRADQDPGPLRRQRGKIHELVGAHAQARADFEAALAEAERRGDRRAAFQSLLDIGSLLAASDYARMGQYLLRATEQARALDDGRLLADSLNRLGNWYLNTERPREAQRCHREALDLCEAAGAREGMAATYDMLSIAAVLGGDYVQAIENARRAVELFRELGLTQQMAAAMAARSTRSLTAFASVHVVLDSTEDECLREMGEAIAVARRIGWRPGEAFALGHSATIASAQGDYGAALSRALAALSLAEQIGHAQWQALAHFALAEIWFGLRDIPRGLAQVQHSLRMARAVGSRHLMRAGAGVLAAQLARLRAEDRFDEAESGIFQALGEGETPESAETVGQRHCWAGLAAIRLARGDAAGALALVETLQARVPNLGAPGTSGFSPALNMLRAKCLLAMGQFAECEQAFRAVRQLALRCGARSFQLDAELGLVALYRAGAQAGDLRAAQSRAAALARQLAASVPDPAVRDAYLSLVFREIGE